MPQRSIDDLRQSIKQKLINPLYLLYGAEDFLRSSAERTIVEVALKDAPLREFNDTSYTVGQTEINSALAGAEQLPLMAEKRVVRVRDCHKLREADEETILRYLSRPVASTVLIFIADDLDKRRRLTKAFFDKCYAVEFALFNDAELMKWARKHLHELRVTCDERTLAHIIALVGSDLRTLSNELDKLAMAGVAEGRITWELADSLVSRSREISNFALSDYLLAGDRPRAIQTLKKLLDDKTEPVMLLGLLASHFHRLSLAKELMVRGAPRDEVFRLVAMPYYKREEFLGQARRSDAGVLGRNIQLIAAADLAIKTSKGTPRLQMEILVSRLIG